MTEHRQLLAKWKKDPKFNQAYDALQDEFSLFDEMIAARTEAGLTQEDVANKMGTKTPAIARLEASGGKKRHSPTLSTLKRYADALGYRLIVKFEKQKIKHT